MLTLKESLFQQCEDFVNTRLQTIQIIISSHQKALSSETKSSAGDKHETGRAMLQLEMEKASQQLVGITQMKEILARIDINKLSSKAHLGSIVFTDKANYFLSISAGQLEVLNDKIFAISVSSPIGKMLLGKEENDVVAFNGNTINLQKIN